MSVLAHAGDGAGAPLGLTELVESLRLLILAGHETTASVLAWLVVELARDPALFADLGAEAQGVGGIPTTPQAAKARPLAAGLFRETLRLYPPAYLTIRILGEELTVYGRTLPPGQLVAMALGDLGRDERIFPEPERHNPRRWTASARDRDRSGWQSSSGAGALPSPASPSPPSPPETAQFGGGPRFASATTGRCSRGRSSRSGCAAPYAARPPPAAVRRPPRSIYYPLHHPSARTKVEPA